MRIRSFIIAYVLIVAILLFADRRPNLARPTHYSHVVDLTDGPASLTAASAKSAESKTRIIAPAALIPGTWTAGQIPQERLVAPLVVMDLHSLHLNTVDSNVPAATGGQISLDDIATWESTHGMIPAGSLIAIRRSTPAGATRVNSEDDALPIERDAAQFLIAARSTIGFATETPVDFTSDRELARQLALHGNYVVESASGFKALPETGSLIIVAPAKNVKPGRAQVRILAMVH